MVVVGKEGISARVVSYSVTPQGKEILTYELEYPRFIHSEFMTHRMISRNAASSRAIPVDRMISMVRNRPATPVHWGANQRGMQASTELSGLDRGYAKHNWVMASIDAADNATDLMNLGLHKQIVNRVLESYSFIKVVATATEWDNFFYLRDHEDAQPEIAELARCMREAKNKSTPMQLETGEWHLPYVDAYRGSGGKLKYKIPAEDNDYSYGAIYLELDEAIRVSASCCAQVSYRLLDNSVDKALDIYKRLVESKPVHASPFEHQATPISCDSQSVLIEYTSNWDEGVTHMDKNKKLWSGNFQGWIQHRQLINGHVYTGGL